MRRGVRKQQVRDNTVNIADRARFAEQVKQKMSQHEPATQPEWAERIGVTTRQFGRVVRGERAPDHVVDKVVRHFEMDVDPTAPTGRAITGDRELDAALRQWGALLLPVSQELRERLVEDVWLYLGREIRRSSEDVTDTRDLGDAV